MANTYVGTPYYMSPEVLLDQPLCPQSDIWSLGCVIYELCSLHPPFQAKSHLQLAQKIRQGSFPNIPEIYSSTLSKTISACLNLNPANRPTTFSLLRLDIIKLCRKERDILDMHKSLKAIEEALRIKEQMLMEREAHFNAQIEAKRSEIETDFYNRLESEVTMIVDQEVNRRMELWLAGQQVNEILVSSPADVHMSGVNQSSPTVSRTVKGPRSIQSTKLLTPLRHRKPLIDLGDYNTGSHIYDELTPDVDSETILNRGLYDSSGKPIPQRAAPHYQMVHGSKGIAAAAAMAKVMGVKGAPGIIGRTAVQIRKESNSRVWDENTHGDDMPSPFLKRSGTSDMNKSTN